MTQIPPIADALPADVDALMADILYRGSAVRMRVTGRSMLPLVPSGATVIVRPVDPQTLRPGDIVLYKNTLGAAVLHRIIRVDMDPLRGKVFRTKGDAVIAFDAPVTLGQVLGRAVRIERPLRCGRCWTVDLDSLGWRRAGRVMALFQLVVSKALLTILR